MRPRAINCRERNLNFKINCVTFNLRQLRKRNWDQQSTPQCTSSWYCQIQLAAAFAWRPMLPVVEVSPAFVAHDEGFVSSGIMDVHRRWNQNLVLVLRWRFKIVDFACQHIRADLIEVFRRIFAFSVLVVSVEKLMNFKLITEGDFSYLESKGCTAKLIGASLSLLKSAFVIAGNTKLNPGPVISCGTACCLWWCCWLICCWNLMRACSSMNFDSCSIK